MRDICNIHTTRIGNRETKEDEHSTISLGSTLVSIFLNSKILKNLFGKGIKDTKPIPYCKIESTKICHDPNPGRDWHPHLPSYVSEPTNLNLNISR